MILLDTNVVITYLDMGKPLLDWKAEEYAVSTVAVAESLRLPGLSEREYRTVKEFLRRCLVIPVSEEIAEQAAFIGRTRRKKLPDLLIAATALSIGAKLMTTNVKGFRGIPGLEIKK